jgi:hypothetical protein
MAAMADTDKFSIPFKAPGGASQDYSASAKRRRVLKKW